MKGVIITNQELGHNKYKINRLLEEFNKVNIYIDVVINDGSIAFINGKDIVINLPKYDFVIYLDKDIYLAKLLERAGYRLFNRSDFIKLCDDKILTHIALSNLNIRMPKTFAAPLIYSTLKDENYNFLNKISEELKYPFIVKKVYSSLGEGVYLINNYDELKKVYSSIYNSPTLFQEYIPETSGRSMRVIIIDNKVLGAFIRTNDKDFRSNYGLSASSKKVVGYENFLKKAQEIADLLNIEYAGIDFLFGKDDEPILCEINSNAFFEEFEKVTKINVAEAFIKMIIKKIGG